MNTEPITLVHKQGPFGDETSIYDVHINRQNLTVNELIKYVLTIKDEWGYIDIGDTFPREHRLEYRYGKIISDTIPTAKKQQCISNCFASGGWTRMDYIITELK